MSWIRAICTSDSLHRGCGRKYFYEIFCHPVVNHCNANHLFVDYCRPGETTRNTESKNCGRDRGAEGPLALVNQRHSHSKQKIQIRPQTSAPQSWRSSIAGRALRNVQQHFSFAYILSIFLSNTRVESYRLRATRRWQLARKTIVHETQNPHNVSNTRGSHLHGCPN